MPQNFEIVDESKRQNPMLGLIGFIVVILIGGGSFAVSGPVTNYLQTANVVLGASGVKILPMAFPPDWSQLGNQLAVTAGLFLILFVIAMLLMFIFMTPKSEGETSVSMDTIRQEAKARRKR
jgi:predicted acyltransferase